MNKTYILVLASALLVGVARAQTNLDQSTTILQQRIQAYQTGADIQADLPIYFVNYNNDSFWKFMWQTSPWGTSQPTADVMAQNWYQQMRLLKIHFTQSIAHMRDSEAWISGTTALKGDDGKAVTITRTRVWLSGYTYNAVINGKTLTSWSLSDLIKQLQTAWLNQTSTDPSGRLIERDAVIALEAIPNSSQYQLSIARGSTQPDSSLFSLLVTSNDVTQITGALNPDGTSNPIVAPQTNDFSYDSALQSMIQAGTIVKPGTTGPNGDPYNTLFTLFYNPSTDPRIRRTTALTALFNDLVVGSFPGYGNSTYVFKPILHSTTFNTAMTNYRTSCENVINWCYQPMLNMIDTQLAEANSRDQQMLGMISEYRDQRAQQDPIGMVISKGDAQQIFQQEVGNMNLGSIPLIGIAAYAIYIYGPPWAFTQCFDCGIPYVPNPLYYTIIAQLVRQLVPMQGQVFTGQNMIQNMLKNQMQQENAVVDVQTRVAFIKDLQLKVEEYEKSFGNTSLTPKTQETGSSIATVPLMDKTFDPLAGAAMKAVDLSRQASTNLAAQQKLFFDATTSQATMVERAATRTQQDATKAQALADLAKSLNDRAVFRAAQRNLDAQKEQEKAQIQKASRNLGLE